MILLEYPFFNIEECDEIKKYAYEKEIELYLKEKISPEEKTPLKKYNNSITTNNYNNYNFFRDHPIYADRLVNLLKETNAPLEWPIMVQSWVNIYRKDDGIGWHRHNGNCYSFNIFIDGETSPGPAYILAGKDGDLDPYDMKVKNFKNKKGYMQIFPSSTFHKVDPINSTRITVGATIHDSFNKKENDGLLQLS